MKTITSHTVSTPIRGVYKKLSLTDRSNYHKAPMFTVAVNNTVIANYDTLDEAYEVYNHHKASMS